MWTLPTVFTIIIAVINATPPAEIRYEWKYANFTWPSSQAHDQAIASGDYMPEHNPVAGIKVWKDKFYVTIPRLRPGVPVTLATISYQSVDGNKSPNLEPYPNWQMQKIGDCSAFQFVQSMEIDPKGRMWVLNTGRINVLDKPISLCPHRLMIFDLENDDKVLLNYEFPKDVADPESGYLNDIVLDHRDGGFAYITNADNVKPSIIVFSLKYLTSWQKTDASMKGDDVNFSIKGDDTKVKTPINIDGIALSPADSKKPLVYFAPMSSKKIFTVSTADLKDVNKKLRVKRVHPERRWHTDGMIMNSRGELFMGNLEDDAVARYKKALISYKVAFRDEKKLQWQDAFAIDEAGNMWLTSDRLQKLAADVVNIAEINYRLFRLDRTDCKSYQYYKNGTAPALPVIPNSN